MWSINIQNFPAYRNWLKNIRVTKFGLMRHENTLTGDICKIKCCWFSYPLLEEILESPVLFWREIPALSLTLDGVLCGCEDWNGCSLFAIMRETHPGLILIPQRPREQMEENSPWWPLWMSPALPHNLSVTWTHSILLSLLSSVSCYLAHGESQLPWRWDPLLPMGVTCICGILHWLLDCGLFEVHWGTAEWLVKSSSLGKGYGIQV